MCRGRDEEIGEEAVHLGWVSLRCRALEHAVLGLADDARVRVSPVATHSRKSLAQRRESARIRHEASCLLRGGAAHALIHVDVAQVEVADQLGDGRERPHRRVALSTRKCVLLAGAAWDRGFNDDGDAACRGRAYDANGVGGESVGVHCGHGERPCLVGDAEQVVEVAQNGCGAVMEACR